MDSDWTFVRRGLLLCGCVALALAAWELASVLLQMFAAALVALALHAIAQPVARLIRCPERYAILLGVVLVAGGAILVFYLFGSAIRVQVSELVKELPEAWTNFQNRFDLHGLSDDLLRRAEAAAPSGATILSAVQGFTSNVANTLLGVFLVLVGGIYLAVDPELYVRLFLALWPAERQPLVRVRLDSVARALRQFLKAQLIAMVVVGILSGVGLAALGIPSALALGLFTGLAEFVPMVGPVVSAIPALLMALTVGTDAALWTLALYVVVQQVESNIISPILQQQMVSLPPAVSLFAVVVFGALFGAPGVFLAIPLTVLMFAAAGGEVGQAAK